MTWTVFFLGHSGVDDVQETNELLMAMALHPLTDGLGVEKGEGCEQGRGARTFVGMRQGPGPGLLQRQAGLGAVERLDLALLIDRQNNGVVWRTDIEPDGIQANISPLRVLQSAFDFDLIRPGWLVLGAGLIVVALDFACARFAKQRRAARQAERVLAARLIRHPSDRLATITASAARHPEREVWLSALLAFDTRELQGRAADFWQVTGDALDFALETLAIDKAGLRDRLMKLYLTLDAFPEVPDVLRRLKNAGLRTAILSNGSPKMLDAVVGASAL